MHSRDPTGSLGESLPRVYEEFMKFYESSSSNMTEYERERNRVVEQHCLSPIAPLGSDPQAHPRSEIASSNSTLNNNNSTTNNNSLTSSSTTSNNNDTTTSSKSNRASSLATSASLATSTLSTSSSGNKKKKKSYLYNGKRVCA